MDRQSSTMKKKWWQKEWDPIGNLVSKVRGKETAKIPPGRTVPPKKAEPDVPGDLKELEKKGMLGQFFRKWKDPAFMKQLRGLATRMQADGVNVKDSAAVKKWIEAHKKEIESGEIKADAPVKQETFVKKDPGVGRNDPCTCGSGKKYKKCCGR